MRILATYNNYTNRYKRSVNSFTGGGESSFSKAVKLIEIGDIEAVKRLSDLQLYSSTNESLLHVASKYDRFDIAKYLLKVGVGKDSVDDNKETVVFFAKTPKMLNLFVQNGLDINHKNKFGKTPIFRYVLKKQLQMVAESVKLGANTNIFDLNKMSPLMYASTNDIREILLANSASSNLKYSDGYSILHKAVMNNDYDYSKLLVKYGTNISIKDIKGHRPLYYVKHPKIRELFLTNGANPNEDYYLHYSILLKDKVAMSQFLQYGANPNVIAPNGKPPIFFVSSVDEINELSKYDTNLDAQDKDGNTALHQFSLLGKKDLVEGLKSLGADISIKNNKGQTASDLFMLWEKYNFWVK